MGNDNCDKGSYVATPHGELLDRYCLFANRSVSEGSPAMRSYKADSVLQSHTGNPLKELGEGVVLWANNSSAIHHFVALYDVASNGGNLRVVLDAVRSHKMVGFKDKFVDPTFEQVYRMVAGRDNFDSAVEDAVSRQDPNWVKSVSLDTLVSEDVLNGLSSTSAGELVLTGRKYSIDGGLYDGFFSFASPSDLDALRSEGLPLMYYFDNAQMNPDRRLMMNSMVMRGVTRFLRPLSGGDLVSVKGRINPHSGKVIFVPNTYLVVDRD